MCPEYAVDSKGFYNRHVFEQTGLKFRPLDQGGAYGAMHFDHPDSAAQRQAHRDRQTQPTPKYQSAKRIY